MAKRICDPCGKNKDVSGGKTCDKGHIVCRSCLGKGAFSSGRSIYPTCKTKLK